MTETTPTVHQAWSDLMGRVRAVAKDEVNKAPGQGGYKFRGIDAVMNAVGPEMREVGLFVVPVEVTSKHRDFTSKNGATMHEAIVTVTYEVYGPQGDSFRVQSIGESADASDKATAQAMSVAYRTLLLQGLTLPTDDPDPDASSPDRAAHSAPAPAPKPEFTQDEREGAYAELEGMTKRKGNPGAVLDWISKGDVTNQNLTRAQAIEWYTMLDKLPDTIALQGDGPPAENPLPDAERKRTWDSLVARHEALSDADQATIADRLKETFGDDWAPTPENLSRNRAATWLTAIEACEQALEAPFT